jgi:hypothetical protein
MAGNDVQTNLNLTLGTSSAGVELDNLIKKSQDAIKEFSDLFAQIGKNVDQVVTEAEKIQKALEAAFAPINTSPANIAAAGNTAVQQIQAATAKAQSKAVAAKPTTNLNDMITAYQDLEIAQNAALANPASIQFQSDLDNQREKTEILIEENKTLHKQYIEQKKIELSVLKTFIKEEKRQMDTAIRTGDTAKADTHAANITATRAQVTGIQNDLKKIIDLSKQQGIVIDEVTIRKYNQLIETLKRYDISLEVVTEREKEAVATLTTKAGSRQSGITKARDDILAITRNMNTLGVDGANAAVQFQNALRLIDPIAAKVSSEFVTLTGAALGFAGGLEDVMNRFRKLVSESGGNVTATGGMLKQINYMFNSINALQKAAIAGTINIKQVRDDIVQIGELQTRINDYSKQATLAGEMTVEMADSLKEMGQMALNAEKDLKVLQDRLSEEDRFTQLKKQADQMKEIYESEKRIADLRGATAYRGQSFTQYGEVMGNRRGTGGMVINAPTNLLKGIREARDLMKGGADASYLFSRALHGSSVNMDDWAKKLRYGGSTLSFVGQVLGKISGNEDLIRINKAFQAQGVALRIESDELVKMSKNFSNYIGLSEHGQSVIADVAAETKRMASATDSLNRNILLNKDTESDMVAIYDARKMAMTALVRGMKDEVNATEEDRKAFLRLAQQYEEYGKELDLTRIRSAAQTKAIKESGRYFNEYGEIINKATGKVVKGRFSVDSLASSLLKLVKLPFKVIISGIQTLGNVVSTVVKKLVSFPVNTIKGITNGFMMMANSMQSVQMAFMGGTGGFGPMAIGSFFGTVGANMFNKFTGAIGNAIQAITSYNSSFENFAAIQRAFYTAHYDGLTIAEINKLTADSFLLVSEAADKSNMPLNDMAQIYTNLQKLGLSNDKWLLKLVSASRASGVSIEALTKALYKMERGEGVTSKSLGVLATMLTKAGYNLKTITTDQFYNFISTNKDLIGVLDELEKTYGDAWGDIVRYSKMYIEPISHGIFQEGLAPILVSIRDTMKELVPTIQAVAANIGTFFSNVITEAWNTLKSITSLKDAFYSILPAINALVTGADDAMRYIENIVVKTIRGISEIISTLAGTGKHKIKWGDLFAKFVPKSEDTKKIEKQAKATGDMISEAADQAKAFKDVAGMTVEEFTKLSASLSDEQITIINDTAEMIKTRAKSVVQNVKKSQDEIDSAVLSWRGRLMKAMSTDGSESSIAGVVKGWVDTLVGNAVDIQEYVTQAIRTMAASGALKKFKDRIEAANRQFDEALQRADDAITSLQKQSDTLNHQKDLLDRRERDINEQIDKDVKTRIAALGITLLDPATLTILQNQADDLQQAIDGYDEEINALEEDRNRLGIRTMSQREIMLKANKAAAKQAYDNLKKQIEEDTKNRRTVDTLTAQEQLKRKKELDAIVKDRKNIDQRLEVLDDQIKEKEASRKALQDEYDRQKIADDQRLADLQVIAEEEKKKLDTLKEQVKSLTDVADNAGIDGAIEDLNGAPNIIQDKITTPILDALKAAGAQVDLIKGDFWTEFKDALNSLLNSIIDMIIALMNKAVLPIFGSKEKINAPNKITEPTFGAPYGQQGKSQTDPLQRLAQIGDQLGKIIGVFGPDMKPFEDSFKKIPDLINKMDELITSISSFLASLGIGPKQKTRGWEESMFGQSKAPTLQNPIGEPGWGRNTDPFGIGKFFNDLIGPPGSLNTPGGKGLTLSDMGISNVMKSLNELPKTFDATASAQTVFNVNSLSAVDQYVNGVTTKFIDMKDTVNAALTQINSPVFDPTNSFKDVPSAFIYAPYYNVPAEISTEGLQKVLDVAKKDFEKNSVAYWKKQGRL